MLRIRLGHFLCLGLAFAVFASGCHGPLALRMTRQKYNEAIQRTENEELLLNLVRLRYRDRPTFLNLQSLTTQFEFAKGASIDGRIIEGPVPNILDLGASAGMSERPTISYGRLQGKEFVTQLVSPMKAETIVLLTESGWSISRVFQLTVQEMNGILNAPKASGPTPKDAPVFRTFNQTVNALRQVQIANALDLGYTSEDTIVSTIKEDAVDGAHLVAATKAKLQFKKTNLGYVLYKKTKILQLARRGEVTESNFHLFQNLLNTGGVFNDPGGLGSATRFDLINKQKVKLKIQPRSLVGVLFYLSHVVDVPPEHYAQGLVPITTTADGQPFDWTEVAGNLFRVHVCRKKPKNAYVSVRHRGYWFFIPDDHLSSKATFTLLSGLIQLQAGGGEVSAAPALTLNVGR